MDSTRKNLIYLWLFLSVITVASWWMGRNTGAAYHVNEMVTLSVFLVAAIKSYFVLSHFMEVRHAPLWLKRTTLVWLVFLFAMLTGFYVSSLPN